MEGFNVNKFLGANFEPRTEDVKVESAKEYFEGDPVWTVRGLTGVEVAQVNEAQERNRNMSAIVEGLVSADKAELVESIREKLGIGDAVPNEIARRLEVLVLGSVKPDIEHNVAVKLASVYPVEFMDLTNKILNLTGLGQMPGKPPGSTEGQTLE